MRHGSLFDVGRWLAAVDHVFQPIALGFGNVTFFVKGLIEIV